MTMLASPLPQRLRRCGTFPPKGGLIQQGFCGGLLGASVCQPPLRGEGTAGAAGGRGVPR
jgi:hypothetical protein